MVHRRLQQDDSRGVQEPLNETMCGCNDINAPPGQMGEHGSEGDGGCECAGLTMRGRHLLILDTVANANRIRRTVNRELQFPATIALGSGDQAPSIASYSMVAKALPANVGLMTLEQLRLHPRWKVATTLRPSLLRG